MVIPIERVGRAGAERTPLVVGNWKMNTSLDEALELGENIVDVLDALEEVETIICPPSIWLPLVYEQVEGTRVRLGAQNVFWHDWGAFTGELGPAMVAEFCDAVIVGHSERRQILGETDEQVNKKVLAALQHDLMPIVCVGENVAERDAGQALAVIGRQLSAALVGLESDQVALLSVAYEPVWAIGTGRTASPDDAEQALNHLRGLIKEAHGPVAAASVRLLYGGSVNPRTIGGLIAKQAVDGVLVGSASLNANDFVAITEAVAKRRG